MLTLLLAVACDGQAIPPPAGFVQGKHAFVPRDGQLHVVDISRPAVDPEMAGSSLLHPDGSPRPAFHAIRQRAIDQGAPAPPPNRPTMNDWPKFEH